MKKTTHTPRFLREAFEHPWVFRLNQVLLDGGKTGPIRLFLEDVAYESVLDIGCGPGTWTKLARGPYLGIDTSPSFIRSARRRYHKRPDTAFVLGDATALEPERDFDLALLISVLHHLDDSEADRLLAWIARRSRHLFVLDLYPVTTNPVSRFLYAMDRGDYIRSPEAQAEIFLRRPEYRLVKQGDFFSLNRTYRHTMFLFEMSQAGE